MSSGPIPWWAVYVPIVRAVRAIGEFDTRNKGFKKIVLIESSSLFYGGRKPGFFNQPRELRGPFTKPNQSTELEEPQS